MRPIVSSIASPCYALGGYLQKILNPLAGHTESFVRNSKHFNEILEKLEVKRKDIFVGFDVVSVFTNVPDNEALKDIRN
jgi:hypothetical protein